MERDAGCRNTDSMLRLWNEMLDAGIPIVYQKVKKIFILGREAAEEALFQRPYFLLKLVPKYELYTA
jgi:hypothetical protein